MRTGPTHVKAGGSRFLKQWICNRDRAWDKDELSWQDSSTTPLTKRRFGWYSRVGWSFRPLRVLCRLSPPWILSSRKGFPTRWTSTSVYIPFTSPWYPCPNTRARGWTPLMNPILVVDDDVHLRELVRVFLQREGFAVVEAIDGVEALEKLATCKADLVILDIMMPQMDGWELCRQLRMVYDIPILMLTAKGETSQKLKGFQIGTDDYVVKPFEPLEVVARVKALLNRYRIATSQTIRVGELRMDRNTFEVVVHDEPMTLPLKEFEVLFKLAGSPGRTFSRDQLIEDIWGYDFDGNERTLDVHINRLRARFPEEHHSFRIRTIRGLGYRLEVRS